MLSNTLGRGDRIAIELLSDCDLIAIIVFNRLRTLDQRVLTRRFSSIIRNNHTHTPNAKLSTSRSNWECTMFFSDSSHCDQFLEIVSTVFAFQLIVTIATGNLVHLSKVKRSETSPSEHISWTSKIGHQFRRFKLDYLVCWTAELLASISKFYIDVNDCPKWLESLIANGNLP